MGQDFMSRVGGIYAAIGIFHTFFLIAPALIWSVTTEAPAGCRFGRHSLTGTQGDKIDQICHADNWCIDRCQSSSQYFSIMTAQLRFR